MNRQWLFRLGMVLTLMAWLANSGVSGDKDKPTPDATWGPVVDGLACRLIVGPEFVPGQAVSITVEVKNLSDKKRFIVPNLNPHIPEYAKAELTGPKGQSLKQSSWGGSGGRGFTGGPKSFQPIDPGEVKRYVVSDLREFFNDLQNWEWKQGKQHFDLPAGSPKLGKYSLSLRFRSPKVPARFTVGMKVVNGQVQTIYEDPSPELVAGQWANEITSKPVSFELRPLKKEDLVVHEWGVFTVFNDVKYANVNRKAEWGNLPNFFYRQFPTERLRWAPSAWDKPVIYFYAKPPALNVNVKVTFAEGTPVVWWPAAASPVDDSPGRGGMAGGKAPGKDRPFRALTWDAWLGGEMPSQSLTSPLRAGKTDGWSKVTDFELPADCWLNQARLPDATPLTVWGSHVQRSAPWITSRQETERFLYYDGLVPTPNYLRCEKVEGAALTFRNVAKFDLGPLFIVDRRQTGPNVSIGFQMLGGKEPKLKSGEVRTITPRSIARADWPAEGVHQVRQALIDAGLFEAEANVILKLWSKQLFEAEGVTAFHILPRSEYDRMLPLEIYPAPVEKPVRVGIALHPHLEIEPELGTRVATLIRQLDDERFETREAASKTLTGIGPLAIRMMREALEKGPSLELRRRLEAILNNVDAAEWLRPVVPAKPAEPKK